MLYLFHGNLADDVGRFCDDTNNECLHDGQTQKFQEEELFNKKPDFASWY